MNKERKATATMLAELMKVAALEGASKRLSRVIDKALDDLTASEDRALKGMEPYKANATTATNYAAGEASLDCLHDASEYILEGDMQSAAVAVEQSYNPPAPVATTKKPRR